MLLLLLIGIALHIPITGDIRETNEDRGFLARAAGLVVNLGLSIGASSLLFLSRPRDDKDGARQ